MAKWIVVPVEPEGYQEVARAPDSKLSVTKATEYVGIYRNSSSWPPRMLIAAFPKILQSVYTMYSEEVDDGLQIIPVRDKLSKTLVDLVPEVYDEVAATFEDEFPLEDKGALHVRLSDSAPSC